MYIVCNKNKILRKSIHGNDTNFEAGELCFNTGTEKDTDKALNLIKKNFKIGSKNENLSIATKTFQITNSDDIQTICKADRYKVGVKTGDILIGDKKIKSTRIRRPNGHHNSN